MIQSGGGSKGVVAGKEGMEGKEGTEGSTRNDWLSVLLEILMKLCDIREHSNSLEPALNQSYSAQDSYKKKGNGLRRLKGPDRG